MEKWGWVVGVCRLVVRICRGFGVGAVQVVRGNYKSFKGINLTVLGRKKMHQFIMGGGGLGRGRGGWGSSLCVYMT